MKPNGIVCEAELDEEFYIFIHETVENRLLPGQKGWVKAKWDGHSWVPKGCCNTIYELYLVDEDRYYVLYNEDLAHFPRKEKLNV